MQAAIPIGSALAGEALAPAMGAGLTAMAGTQVPAWLSSAASSALLGGLGSYAMGQNPLQGMLLGGIGGGLSHAIGLGDKMGALFGGGVNPGTDAAVSALDEQLSGKPAAAATATASQPSTFAKFLPYAGIGAAALLADKSMAPEQVGPPMRKPLQDRPVSPLEREYQDVDPSSYYGIGGNRNFFRPYSMQPTYFKNGGSSGAASANIPLPIRRRMTGKISGPGNGTSDSIPAMLSDGEHVVTEREVTKLGGGSNERGQKKMYEIRKKIRSGGGIGSYAVH